MKKSQIKALKQAIRTYTDRATKSRAKARATLIKEGIYLDDGSLSPNYQPAKKTAA
ncbi:MAG: hypothetical protein ABW166_05975 [Sedimenticola sp.]